ncbi:MAG TPA: hypothetical protein VMV52_09490 [Candidatus Nanopelagicaceae bacterium]|nr:hypothetical protein [Candidatus Nanopelagicaceae bacterium]
MRSKISEQRGSISPLIIGALLIGTLLLHVIVDSSRFFLAHRELITISDSTALVAARALDQTVYYLTGSSGVIPIDRDEALRLAEKWVASARIPNSRLQNLKLVALGVDNGRVIVTLSAQVPGGLLSGNERSGYVTLKATSSAVSRRD